jgi:apolipoprotein N-acyltransferase
LNRTEPGNTRRDLLAGALFVACYALGTPGYDVPYLPFFCMAPFLVLTAESPSVRGAAWRGWLAGTAGSLPLYYWIGHTIAVEGKLGWPLGCLAVVLVSAYLGAYFSLAGAAARRLVDRFGGKGLWIFPFAWTALELARTYLFTGFPWMLLGYSLADSSLLRQAADLAGIPGLSFLLALSGVSFYRAGSTLARRSLRAALPQLAPALAVIVFLPAYGSYAIGLRDTPAVKDAAIKVAIAQGGIDQSVKWDPEYQTETLDIYEALTMKARREGAELVVWPETAAPFFFGWEEELSRRLEGIVEKAGIPVIFGAPWFDPADGGRFYNSVFYMNGRGVVVGRYDKHHLVPFSEYIPLRSVLFFLRKLTEGAEDFSPGTTSSLFRVHGHEAGASVCYEAIFPAITRRSVREGARWLVNVTNDAWFGDTVAPYQHLAMARMRCVEFRRPMVRAANAGISAFIDATGKIDAELGLFRRGTVAAVVVPRSGATLYGKSGEVFGISCIIIAILTIFFPLRGSHGNRLVGREDGGA